MNMESNVWKKAIDGIEEVENINEKLPSEIVKEYCDQLEDVTDGRVMAKIGQYSHSIKDMTKEGVFSIFPNSKTYVTGEENPQDYLGIVDEESRFTYEIYITGSKTKNYKYRFCFIEFGIPAYPTDVIIDSDIADELQISTTYNIKNSDEFKNIFVKILNSNKITEVIKSLMAVNS